MHSGVAPLLLLLLTLFSAPCAAFLYYSLLSMLLFASNADMNFGEITEIAPWDILAHDCGQDLNADQPGELCNSRREILCHNRVR